MFDRVVLIIGLREIPSSCGTREVEDSEGERKRSKVYSHRLFHTWIKTGISQKPPLLQPSTTATRASILIRSISSWTFEEPFTTIS